MHQILFWIYLTNTVLLIVHEMDSAYWKEWELFGLPGGISGFLAIHVPLFFLGLYGLVLVFQRILAGLILSLIMSLAGTFAFAIHNYFIRQGHHQFKTLISQLILASTLVVSIIQIILTTLLLIQA